MRAPLSFLRDRGGAVLAEFAISGTLMVMLLICIVEISAALWAWNATAKAVQQGARLAAISAPVSSDLATMTGLEGGAAPGAAMPYFYRSCNGATSSCSNGGTFSQAALNWIVRGPDGVCGGSDTVRGLCDINRRITAQNVVVVYEQTGLGFAGRPAGPVPSITVRVQGLSFATPVLGIFTNMINLTMPAFSTTVSGEDLRSVSP